MNNPLISIVIPVYKTEKFLNKCVESVVNQTYKNLEIILVDDGSTDNCPKMCDFWAEKDGRIKVIHKENGGAFSAKNVGIDAAVGDYIGFVDSDDYIELDMYEILLSIAQKYNADITMCKYQINDEDIGVDSCFEISKDEVMKNVLIGGYEYGILCNKLYRRDVVKNLKMPPLKCSEDLPYNYFAMTNSKRFAKTELKLYHYYQNDNSIVHSKFGKDSLDAVKAREIMLNDVNEDLKRFAVKGVVISDFVALSRLISSQQCIDKYDELRNNILKYKKEILTSSLYSVKDKIKTVILLISPRIYNKFVK